MTDEWDFTRCSHDELVHAIESFRASLSASEAEVKRLKRVIDDLPSWAFGWGDKVMWQLELRRRAGGGNESPPA